jgi:teichoic acid transport system permease protein
VNHEAAGPEYVFEANSPATPDIRDYLSSLWERRHFMGALARAELPAEGANTMLGNLWSLANPLFQAGIYYFLYTVLRSGSEHAQFFPC